MCSSAGLLEVAGMLSEVADLELHAGDGYLASITLSETVVERTIAAHVVNGASRCRCSMVFRCG
jgi:hypothetical protein